MIYVIGDPYSMPFEIRIVCEKNGFYCVGDWGLKTGSVTQTSMGNKDRTLQQPYCYNTFNNRSSIVFNAISYNYNIYFG